MTPEDIRMLFDYDAWANERARAACAPLTPEQFTRSLGSSFGSVRDTLVHIFGAQWIWLERFEGRSPDGLPAPETCPDFASVASRAGEIQHRLIGYVAGVTAADLEHTLQYRDTKGNTHQNPLGPVLQHLANHGTYHRGQITTMLRQLGAKPVSTDLIAFYRQRAAKTAS